MAAHPLRRWLPELITAAALGAAPWLLPPIGFSADLITRILIWGLFGLGFDLLFGFTGLLSFGQAAFYGAGGFVTAYLVTAGIIENLFLCLFIGTVVATCYGLLIGVFALRRTGLYFAMITLAFGEMSYFLDISPLSDFTGGENGLPGIPVPEVHLGPIDFVLGTGWPMYGFVAFLFWLGFVIARRIVRSPFGMILISIRENTARATALGHKVQRYKLAVFAVAAAYGGLAGGLLGVLQNYMPPGAFALGTSGQLVIQTVIGGAGTLFGPLVGATVWLWLRETLQYIPDIGSAWKLILGLIFILLVTVFRRGLCGEILHFTYQRRLRALTAATGAQQGEPHADAGAGAPDRTAPSRDPGRAEDDDAQPSASLLRGKTRQLEPADGVAAIETRDLTKHYGGVHAVTDVSLAIATGEVRALIGPNGAGKSTLFKMLTGEVRPSSGEVYLHGHRVTRANGERICQLGMSKSYQINQLFDSLTVRQNLLIPVLGRTRGAFALDLFKNLHGVNNLDDQVAYVLDTVGLAERANWPITMLAYGEKRRLEIGLALATSPTVLLLDEPLAGMSPAERTEMVTMLKRVRRGRTLVVVEHDMDAIFSLADRITVLNEGELLADGRPDEIQGSARVQDAYLGGMNDDEPA